MNSEKTQGAVYELRGLEAYLVRKLQREIAANRVHAATSILPNGRIEAISEVRDWVNSRKSRLQKRLSRDEATV